MHTYLLREANNLANFDLGAWAWQGTCCQICAQRRHSQRADNRFAGEGRYLVPLTHRANPKYKSGTCFYMWPQRCKNSMFRP